MIILCNNSHGGIIRVCMGIFTTALRNKKIRQILKKKYLTLLPQRIACYLTAYFDEKSPFERVVHFEVFNVHKKSPFFIPHSWSLGRLWSNLEKSGSCENCRYHLWGVTANHTFQNWIQSTRDFEARVQISLISIAPHLHQITVNMQNKGRFANHN